jgi:hypothetical protein
LILTILAAIAAVVIIWLISIHYRRRSGGPGDFVG